MNADAARKQVAHGAPALVYGTLSIYGLSREFRERQWNIICSYASYMSQFGIRFEDCATVLFVLAFRYQFHANEDSYNLQYWTKAFEQAESNQGLRREQQAIIEYFETHHLRVVLGPGSRRVTIITPSWGVGPQRREMNQYDKGMIRTSRIARRRYEEVGLWQEFEVEIHRGALRFMKEIMFVVAILVGVIFILHHRRSVVMR